MRISPTISDLSYTQNMSIKNSLGLFDSEQKLSFSKINTCFNVYEEAEKSNFMNVDFLDGSTSYNEYDLLSISNSNIYYIHEKKEEKQKIFLIEKDKRSKETESKITQVKRGRRQKNAPLSSEVRHNKYGKDNIILKIKNHFVENMFEYINSKYKDFQEAEKIKYFPVLLKRISTEKYKVYSKKGNQDFLKLSIRDLFASQLNPERYNNFAKKNSIYYNANNIDLLIKENKATEVIELLNMTVEKMYQKYINNEIPECSLENDIIKMIKENKEREYIIKYEVVAKNLITDIYKTRRKKKKKKLFLDLEN